MTPAEFKAWFDGFTEAFTGCPTKAQWARIKDRVAEIDGKAVTERVYIDRYWNRYPDWQPYWRYLATGVGSATTSLASGNIASSLPNAVCYNSLTAMNALGKADAMALSAS